MTAIMPPSPLPFHSLKSRKSRCSLLQIGDNSFVKIGYRSLNFITSPLNFTDLFHVNNINSRSNTCTQYTALTNTPPFSFPGCDGRYRGKVWRTTKANFLCQGWWSSSKRLILCLQFPSSLLLYKNKTGLLRST